ncbi:predicted protein [Plenodomus lingam JN3]|uniref:Predicted protein n=1 Tax=Leptosphaeria maculans (strain JN3 / isolate v23.1.3 / race Av1-4-5-6-7-8) TaxID=985895 RepID=E5ABY5_LEPMJ|nr:predicted protein [Plenodomus lingam JN3]CBY01176.1 predicted protein [Plenodomus lingam JN3]
MHSSIGISTRNQSSTVNFSQSESDTDRPTTKPAVSSKQQRTGTVANTTQKPQYRAVGKHSARGWGFSQRLGAEGEAASVAANTMPLPTPPAALINARL